MSPPPTGRDREPGQAVDNRIRLRPRVGEYLVLLNGLLRPLRKSAGWRPHVDQFVPWAWYPNNAIESLVVAHERCNGEKREFLAASEHVAPSRGVRHPGR